MPKLAMVLEPPDPKMSPRQMVRRDQLMVVGALVFLALVVVSAVKINSFLRERGRFRSAEARLRAVPALAHTHLRDHRSTLRLDRAADLVRQDGTLLGTVALQAGDDLFVSLQTPGLAYKPLTSAELNHYLAPGELLDPDAARFARNAAGALLVLWPDLGKSAIHYDKVEALTLMAPKATVDLGLTLSDNQRLGVAVQLDLVRDRLLSFSLRKR